MNIHDRMWPLDPDAAVARDIGDYEKLRFRIVALRDELAGLVAGPDPRFILENTVIALTEILEEVKGRPADPDSPVVEAIKEAGDRLRKERGTF